LPESNIIQKALVRQMEHDIILFKVPPHFSWVLEVLTLCLKNHSNNNFKFDCAEGLPMHIQNFAKLLYFRHKCWKHSSLRLKTEIFRTSSFISISTRFHDIHLPQYFECA
jgi:hypothetical protein